MVALAANALILLLLFGLKGIFGFPVPTGHYNQEFTTMDPTRIGGRFFSNAPSTTRPLARYSTISTIKLRLEKTSTSESSTVIGDNMNNQLVSDKERQNGILVLMTVPMAWGTFEPAVRYVYEIQPEIPAFVFSFVYYLVAATALVSLALLTSAKDQNKDNDKSLLLSSSVKDTESSMDSQQAASNLLPLLGGLELGTYLFLGNGLQVVGLKTVPSDRAAFLLQLTTIFVPIVQSILSKNLFAVPTKTWVACLIALSGVACIGIDGGSNAGGGSIDEMLSVSALLPSLSIENIQFSIGDFYIALGAFFYTFHCIRLELYAKSTSAVKLAAAKASTETFWCIIVVLISVFVAKSDYSSNMIPSQVLTSTIKTVQSSGNNILDYFNTLSTNIQDGTIVKSQWLKLGIATAWTGLVTVAYTIYAQSFGQSRVVPATANLIYTTQPFFTALIAYIVLGESLGLSGYVGGLLIASAVLLVIQDNGSVAIIDEGENMK